MQPSMVLKFLKVSQPLSLSFFAYFETVQKATVSTAGVQVITFVTLNLPFTDWFTQQTEFKTEFECMEIDEMNQL